MDGFRYNFKGTICILGKTICCIEKLFRIVQRFPEKYLVVTVPPEQLQNTCLLLRFTRRGGLVRNVINLKRLLNGKQNVWKYQNGEEKSDSDGREKDV